MDTKTENNTQGRSSYSADDRQSLIREFEDSGMTQAAFCREWDINPATFSKWIRNERPEESVVSFCEVELPGHAEAADTIVVRLEGGVEIVIPVGVAGCFAATLKEVAACWG